MINIVHYSRLQVIFINSKGKTIIFFPLIQGYTGIVAFQRVSDGIICVLESSHDATNEQRRRNVIQIDENGKIVWTVADTMNIWKPKFPDNPDNQVFLESVARTEFDNVGQCKNKIIIGNSRGELFFLNPTTGRIEFWKAGRF